MIISLPLGRYTQTFEVIQYPNWPKKLLRYALHDAKCGELLFEGVSPDLDDAVASLNAGAKHFRIFERNSKQRNSKH